MKRNSTLDVGRLRWNARIRRFYWFVGLLIITGNLVTWQLIVKRQPDSVDDFVTTHLLWQNLTALGMVGVAELVTRIRRKLQDYAVIFAGAGFPIVILYFTAIEVPGLEFVMLIPIFVSVIYFEYGKVAFASGVSIVLFLVMMTVSPSHRELIPLEQKILGVGIILTCTAAALAIVKRGLRMMKDEQAFLISEEQHRLQKARIDERSKRDALTGLNNHRTFQQHLRLLLEARDQHEPLHLSLIDIDRFKQVNDEFGHLTGDIVLRRIGAAIAECEAGGAFAARYGGEEFAVIFTRSPGGNVLEQLERLRVAVARIAQPELHGRSVTISIGCALLTGGDCGQTLFRNADEALYKAKRNGRNRIETA
jgi:diguanylate cyclase (GGDEF)-like protein